MRFRGEYATYLHERSPLAMVDDDVAEEAVRKWMESAYLDEQTMLHRLRAAGSSRQRFGTLITGAPFSVDAHAVGWVDEVARVLELPAASAPPMSVEVCGEVLERLPFGGMLGRFLRHFERLLREGLARHRSTVEVRETAVESLLEGLAARLAAVSHRTLVCVLATERSAGRLRGADPEARYADFDDRLLGDPAYLEGVLTTYPLLGRCLVESGRNWLQGSLELLRHLDADLEQLQEAELIGGDHRVGHIRCDMGDPHNGGRSVAQVTFVDGSSVVHKPRAVEAERLYENVTAFMTGRTPGVTLRPMRIAAHNGYGWCELVERVDCRDERELAQFYRNLGACLAVLHVLGAIDMHMGNVIASGSSPVPVDLETLLQHTMIEERTSPTANEKALDILAESVLATGVLPLRMFGDGLGAGIDVSAVGGGEAQLATRALPTLVSPFTDEMRVVGQVRQLGTSSNRPAVAGRPADPAEHVEQIRSGFCSAYDTLASNRAIVEAHLDEASDVVVRHLIRNTRRYDLFRYERFHPDYLQDGRSTDQLLDKLWTAAVTRPDLVPVVESERRALLDMDIPSFTTSPADRALRAVGRPEVRGFFSEPSAAAARRRLSQLSPAHRATQLSIIDDALRLLPRPPGTGQNPRRSVQECVPVTDETLRTVIRRTLDDLADEALIGADDCTWIGVGVDGVRDETLAVKPLTTTLYDGLAGMALVFGYAASVLEDERYAEMSRRSARPVESELSTYVRQRDSSRCIGAFAGTAGSLYALHHLNVLDGKGSTDLIAAALDALRLQAEREHAADVVTGLAGSAAVAIGLIDSYGESAAELARTCTDRLAATATSSHGGVGWPLRDTGPALGGFAHGAAGAGWVLLSAGRSLNDDALAELGHRALVYDEGLRIDGEDAWRDLRDFVDRTGIGQSQPTLWCHGAAGVGLSRLLAYQITSRPEYAEQARAAVRATCAASPLNSQGLCHGDAGSMEFLDVATSVLAGCPESAAASATSAHLLASIVSTVRRDGFNFGPISGPKLPGLMMGRAGVALTLLRRLRPGSAPSVLWLEPAQPSGARQAVR